MAEACDCRGEWGVGGSGDVAWAARDAVMFAVIDSGMTDSVTSKNEEQKKKNRNKNFVDHQIVLPCVLRSAKMQSVGGPPQYFGFFSGTYDPTKSINLIGVCDLLKKLKKKIDQNPFVWPPKV